MSATKSEPETANGWQWLNAALRVATAVGAFFLAQTYTMLKDTNEMLNEHMQEFRSLEGQVNSHERDLQRHERRLDQLDSRRGTYTPAR